MKRTEYIDAARQTLAKYDAEYAEDFIRSLEEHFDEGVSEGKSEEELCEELGSIEDVLDELEQAIGETFKKQVDDSDNNESVRNNKVDESRQNVGSEKPAENHREFEIQAISGVRDETAQITKITADLGFADVRIEKTSDSMPSIHLAEDSAESTDWWLDERVEGTTYVVKLSPANGTNQESRAGKKSLLDRFINIVVTPALSYVLLVPENIEKLDFTGTSGDVDIDGLKVGRLDLHSSSGDVDAKNVFAREISIESTSGDIEAANIYAAESLKLTSTSGDVEVESVSGAHVSVKSTSGDVNIEESSAETLEVSSTSGDVEAKNTPMNELTANTVSGDLYLNLCGDMDGTINTMSGDVKIRVDNENRGVRVTFSSMSGAANINYGGAGRRIEKNGTFAVGDESTSLNIRTMSGSANIN